MILEFFGLTILVATLLLVPGWFWAKKYDHKNIWIFALPFVAVAFWYSLMALGVGAQSLSNLIEILPVAAFAVVGGYVKFLFFDPSEKRRTKGFAVAIAIVIVCVIALRLFMPGLPE